MTDVCVISCDRISSDYWFTIKRGHYQETVDEVDTSAKEIVSSIRTPGNTDIVIYRGVRNACTSIYRSAPESNG